MLKDRENHEITISDHAHNEHIKVVGKSGCGKTFWMCQYMKEKSVSDTFLVLDFSGSYTESELRRNNCDIVKNDTFKLYNLNKMGIEISLDKTNAADLVTDSLIEILKIQSIFQKKILRQSCKEVFLKQFFSFDVLYKTIELKTKIEEGNIRENAIILLNRLDDLKTVVQIRININEKVIKYSNRIIEMAELPARKSIVITQFLIAIFWRIIRMKPITGRTYIVLDEFQKLQIRGTSVEEMLREGRKFGVGLIMLTQFISPDEADILEQCATSLFFRPNDRNVMTVAKMLNPTAFNEWFKILKNLKRGECVVNGMLKVNRSKTNFCYPILCDVIVPETEQLVDKAMVYLE